MNYSSGPLEFIFAGIITIVSLIMLICFFVLCWNVGKIKHYARKIFVFEKTRLIEEGIIDPKTNKIVKWVFNEDDTVSKREIDIKDN